VRRESFLERVPRSAFIWTSLLLFFAAFGLVLGPVLALLGVLGLDRGRALSARMAQDGFRGFLAWCGVVSYPRFRGRIPRGGPFVVVSNHASGMDTCCVLAFSPKPLRLVAKYGLWEVPLVGFAVWASGAIFLREERAIGSLDASSVLEEPIRAIRSGISVAFFPEGTRARGRGIRRFRAGAFEVAAATGAPVLPIVIVGTGEFMPAPGVHPLGPYRVTVEILEPRRVEGDLDAFRRSVRDEVAARHAAILAEPFHAPTRADMTTVPTSPEEQESRERSLTSAS
jgi:1-acyl-sn-glycerol-3-phosphate acyltransferase